MFQCRFTDANAYSGPSVNSRQQWSCLLASLMCGRRRQSTRQWMGNIWMTTQACNGIHKGFTAGTLVRMPQHKSYVHELSAAHDMTLLSEVHGDDGVCQAWQRPRDCEAWFSPSAEYGVAGIGLVAKRSFLQSFLPVGAGSRWIEIWRGRIAKLELRGPRGGWTFGWCISLRGRNSFMVI